MSRSDIGYICKHKLDVILNRPQSRVLGDSITRNCMLDIEQEKATKKKLDEFKKNQSKNMKFDEHQAVEPIPHSFLHV